MLFVDFYGWFENDDNVFIAMEYFEHGDLAKYLQTPRTEQNAKSITKQLLDGLEVMHREGFAHRDIKPAVWCSI
jgi:serine/threonine protein kinase